HSVAEKRVTETSSEKVRDDLKQSGFSAELAKATVRKLLKLVRGLHSKRADSGWKSYRQQCSYSDEGRQAKEQFVRDALAGRETRLAWDLGANDGVYSRLAAKRGGYVVALDSDDVTVN